MKLTCDEATTICDKGQYGAASLWELIKLKFHMIFCNKCGIYSKQNAIMTKCYENHKDSLKHHENCLCNEEKKCMEEEVKANM